MSFNISPNSVGNQPGAFDQSHALSHFNLGSFVVGPHSIRLVFDHAKGFFTTLSTNGQPNQNVGLVAPFSKLRSISSQQLYKLSLRLSTHYSVHLSRDDNEQLQVVFISKLLGGGGVCSTNNKPPISKIVVNTPTTSPQQVSVTIDTSNNSTSPQSQTIPQRSRDHIPDKNATEDTLSIRSSSSSSSSAPSSLSNIRSTHDLAYALQKADPSSDEYADFKKLAFKVISAYKEHTPKSPALLKELTTLVQAGSGRISREILTILIEQLISAVFLDEEVLVALRDCIREIEPSHFSPDELTNVLKFIRDKHSCFHSQESNNDKLYLLLHAHSGTLEALGDANVKGLSYESIHDPLYRTLEGLTDHPDWRIGAEASYSKEALLRVAHDKTKLRLFLGRLFLMSKGIGGIVSVYTSKSILPLLQAYKDFKEALHKQQKTHCWYDELRFTATILDQEFYQDFEDYLLFRLDVPKNEKVLFFKNLINLLIENVLHHKNLKIRLFSFNLLRDLYFDEPKWNPLISCLPKADANITKNVASQIKVTLLQLFHEWANVAPSSERAAIGMQAQEVLKTIFTSPRPDQEKWLEQAQVPADFSPTSPSKRFARRSEASFIEANALLKIARAQPRTVLELIKEVRNNYLADKDLEALLSTYIAPSGSKSSSFHDPFVLENEIINFLSHQRKEKILLLLGGSGAGKTTYGKYLTYTLWKDWNDTKPIPLFIPLGALNHPNAKIIEETLAKEGFSDTQIHQLKEEHSFVFILDGYDEMGRKTNLYEEKELKNWKAKIIISCRTQDLQGGKNSHDALFAPIKDSGPVTSLLSELYITPFTEKEIDAYLKQYISRSESCSWTDYREYRKQIDQVPGLFSLITTPFLLFITAEVLPEIVERHVAEKPTEKLQLLGKDLYDAFISKWFIRGEGKLRAAHRLDNFDGDIKLSFVAFCKKLAIKMYEKKITVVHYSPPVYGRADNEWEEFFGNKDPIVPLLRHGAPIQKIDTNKYAFLHKSILEYFIFLDDSGLDSGSDDNPEKEAFSNRSEIFQRDELEEKKSEKFDDIKLNF